MSENCTDCGYVWTYEGEDQEPTCFRCAYNNLRNCVDGQRLTINELTARLSEAEAKVREFEAGEKLKSLMYSEWNGPVDSFALAMKQKLSLKAAEGFFGWDDPSYKDVIEQKFYEHVERQRVRGNQLVDIANLAMMLWNFQQQDAALTQPKADETDWCPNCGGDTDPLDPCEVCHDKGVVKAADEREVCETCGHTEDNHSRNFEDCIGDVLCQCYNYRPSQDAPTGEARSQIGSKNSP